MISPHISNPRIYHKYHKTKTSLLARNCSGFHERVNLRVRLDSCFFLSPRQFCQQFISSSNAQASS
ncbi:hypothetical protein LINPERPRIM_LOCUS13799 [Linum perenne]